MLKNKKTFYWPLENDKKLIIEEEEPLKPLKEFKEIIKQEENLD
jgi:hypothetical protein